MMGFGFLGMVLFWGLLLAVLVGGAVLVLRQTGGTGSPSGKSWSRAREILDERLARGEISREEYDALRVQMER